MPTRDRPRDRFPATDTFLASTSRHVGAVVTVLVPAVRKHLPDGAAHASELVHRCKRLEYAMAQTKAKLYGSTYAIRRPWSSIWSDVHEAFDALLDHEEEMVARLVDETGTQSASELTDMLYRAELHAPTRPHPYIPHKGVPGRVARTVALGVDRFWDTAEGRMVPEPVRIRDHHNGLLAQYLLADPHLPDQR